MNSSTLELGGSARNCSSAGAIFIFPCLFSRKYDTRLTVNNKTNSMDEMGALNATNYFTNRLYSVTPVRCGLMYCKHKVASIRWIIGCDVLLGHCTYTCADARVFGTAQMLHLAAGLRGGWLFTSRGVSGMLHSSRLTGDKRIAPCPDRRRQCWQTKSARRGSSTEEQRRCRGHLCSTK